MKKFLMGNEAIGIAAINAGVNLVCGYPGTPSTEILETVAKNNDGSIYVEWSANEKAALEVAAGASYAGARTLVTMKQVGLNVASDPLMSLSYVGVKGGMVIVSADDPGPISSQTEQDTRHFAHFSKLPVFDPSSPEEAYSMVKAAFELSEKYGTPVLLRPTTRVCHGCATMDIGKREIHKAEGFVKDSKWVIFPKLSYLNHKKIEKRNILLCDVFSSSPFNFVTGTGKKGIATGGISYEYTMEALGDNNLKVFKVGTTFPFPEKLALEFLSDIDEVIVIEELDPVIERELIYICGKYNLKVKIRGKLTGDMPDAGENTVEIVKSALTEFAGLQYEKAEENQLPKLPVRPPVLCAGCPHRASFYAVKKATKNMKTFYGGDIGCYTLGNTKPLDMVDTCLCMGADATIAQGINHIEPDTKCFSFIGDSTFFASGITGVVNAVYNEADITLIVLDNSTTAMTGHQPHPGTGKTMMGHITDKISISDILKAIGVKSVETVNPFELDKSVDLIKRACEIKGVSAVIFKSSCIAITKPSGLSEVDYDKCIGCKKCINEIGCPAISIKKDKPFIEPSLCMGCSLCEQICSVKAIQKRKEC